MAGVVKEFSLSEVSAKNGKNGEPLWIVIKDEVYDVTDFVRADQHPGGAEPIMEVAGKDATKDYKDVGHSSDADKLKQKYIIGRLIEADRKTKSKPVQSNQPKAAQPQENVGGKKSFVSVITCGLCG